MSVTAKTQEMINERVLEEKFSSGFAEFEALIQNISEDEASTLIELLDNFTQ